MGSKQINYLFGFLKNGTMISTSKTVKTKYKERNEIRNGTACLGFRNE